MKFSNKANSGFLILVLIVIIILNILTLSSDANKNNTISLENIESGEYFLLNPILFNVDIEDFDIKDNELSLKSNNRFLIKLNNTNILDNNILDSNILIFKAQINSEIKLDLNTNEIYLICKKQNKSIDETLKLYFLKMEKNIFFIDKNLINDKNLSTDKNKKMIFLKAHFIEENLDTQAFSENENLIKQRIIRAIKERSCSIILNKSKLKIKNELIENIFALPIFIKSVRFKNTLYKLIGLFASFLSSIICIIYFKFQKKIKSSFDKFLNLFLIIYSNFLLINYIISLNSYIHFFRFFDLKIYQSSIQFLFIPSIQVIFFLLEIILLFNVLNSISIKDSPDETIRKIMLAFSITFLTGIIINTLFFLKNLYWLKPAQYLTYFFYFSPLLIFFIYNFKIEKKHFLFYFFLTSIFYLLFKLRDNGLFKTEIEVYFKNYIESILPARFRLREIFFYIFYFSLFFFYLVKNKADFKSNDFSKKSFKTNFIYKLMNNIFISMNPDSSFRKLEKIKSKYPSLYNYFLSFPFLSIINSYYHSYTPLYISFLRTIFALIFGFLISFFLFLFFIFVFNFYTIILYKRRNSKS